jgi:hypothetical protein
VLPSTAVVEEPELRLGGAGEQPSTETSFCSAVMLRPASRHKHARSPVVYGRLPRRPARYRCWPAVS